MRLKDRSKVSADADKELLPYLNPKTVVVRLYVLKGKSLTPKDTNTSDPYLVIKLGDKVIKDMDSLRPKTNNPKFFRSYDITT